MSFDKRLRRGDFCVIKNNDAQVRVEKTIRRLISSNTKRYRSTQGLMLQRYKIPNLILIMAASKKKTPPHNALSQRQAEVLTAFGQNPDPKAIAERLRISVATVNTHLRRTRKKLGVKRTIEAYWLLTTH
jgi:DNA-binding NarL/FixJ family response regulator